MMDMAGKQYQLEYIWENVAPERLWRMVSTEDGLNEWITGRVVFEGDQVQFHWSEYECAVAEMEIVQPGQRIRFRWQDEDGFFDLLIRPIELTGDTLMVITDHAEPDERESSIEIWQQQTTTLRRVLGLRA